MFNRPLYGVPSSAWKLIAGQARADMHGSSRSESGSEKRALSSIEVI